MHDHRRHIVTVVALLLPPANRRLVDEGGRRLLRRRSLLDDRHRLLARDELPHPVRCEDQHFVVGRQLVARHLRSRDHADVGAHVVAERARHREAGALARPQPHARRAVLRRLGAHVAAGRLDALHTRRRVGLLIDREIPRRQRADPSAGRRRRASRRRWPTTIWSRASARRRPSSRSPTRRSTSRAADGRRSRRRTRAPPTARRARGASAGPPRGGRGP